MTDKLIKYSNLFALMCCTAMFLGFFCSRALVSIASILLFANAFLPVNFSNTKKQLQSNKFIIICIVYWICCAFSIMYSNDTTLAQKEIITKLSLLAIPIGMTSLHFKSMQSFVNWILVLNLILQPFVCNSSLIYFQDAQNFKESYMLYTTKYNDHIRFSLSITLLLIINTFLITTQKKHFKNIAIWLLLIIWSLYAAFYLHILSARTGLACLYVFIICYVFYTVWMRHKFLAILSLLAVIGLGYAAILKVPRLQHKVAYMQYEFRQWYEADEVVQYTLSDNNRILSYEVAWESIKNHPLLGVGIGDVQGEMVKIYNEKFPSIPTEGTLKLPHNQFLTTAMALGIPSCIILVLLLITPIDKKFHYRYFLSITMMVFLVAFMIDAMLEVQLGLFLFLFFTMIWLRVKEGLLLMEK